MSLPWTSRRYCLLLRGPHEYYALIPGAFKLTGSAAMAANARSGLLRSCGSGALVVLLVHLLDDAHEATQELLHQSWSCRTPRRSAPAIAGRGRASSLATRSSMAFILACRRSISSWKAAVRRRPCLQTSWPVALLADRHLAGRGCPCGHSRYRTFRAGSDRSPRPCAEPAKPAIRQGGDENGEQRAWHPPRSEDQNMPALRRKLRWACLPRVALPGL